METSVTYSSTLSVADYFAKKMEAKRSKLLVYYEKYDLAFFMKF